MMIVDGEMIAQVLRDLAAANGADRGEENEAGRGSGTEETIGGNAVVLAPELPGGMTVVMIIAMTDEMTGGTVVDPGRESTAAKEVVHESGLTGEMTGGNEVALGLEIAVISVMREIRETEAVRPVPERSVVIVPAHD